MKLKKQFNVVKEELFPWAYDVTKCASEQPFFNLGAAFKKFFNHESKYPRFKKKGRSDSFYLSNDQVSLHENKIHIPKLGLVKMAEQLRFTDPSVKILAATISRKADRWFVAVTVTMTTPMQCENQACIGVDVGLTHLAVLSNGAMIDGPRPLKKGLKKIKRLHRRLSRKKEGSKNRYKARMALARQYLKISDTRNDALHKLSTDLTRAYKYICIEDLNIPGMLKNSHLARSIADMGWGELARQVAYKSVWHGNVLTWADRFFASTKTCSRCGHKKEHMDLSERIYDCACCGLRIDRDLNAARNLEHMDIKEQINEIQIELKIPQATGGINVCGEERLQSSGNARQCSSVKQKSKCVSI